MRKLDIILIAAIAIIAAEILSGIALVTYGMNYVKLDEDAANTMLVFISENNPEYYTRIQDTVDMSYRRDFYSHYMVIGDRKASVAGLILMLIAAGNALPVAAIFLTRQPDEDDENEEEKKNRIDLKAEDETELEAKKQDKPKEKQKEVKTK